MLNYRYRMSCKSVKTVKFNLGLISLFLEAEKIPIKLDNRLLYCEYETEIKPYKHFFLPRQ